MHLGEGRGRGVGRWRGLGARRAFCDGGLTELGEGAEPAVESAEGHAANCVEEGVSKETADVRCLEERAASRATVVAQRFEHAVEPDLDVMGVRVRVRGWWWWWGE